MIPPFAALMAATLVCGTLIVPSAGPGPFAKKTALGAVNASGAAITKGGLEVEDGCLVYSYDIKIPGKNGIEEVIIDAGSGKVLKTEHEGSVKEALEKSVDTMKK